MATSSKSDQPSDSPDRPLYNSGQRGSHIAAQLDRPSSFHESTENPIVSSLPNMARNSSVVAHGDVLNFFQCSSLNPKVVATDHKSSHQGDFKRHINVALGISGDDSPSVLFKSKVLPSLLPGEIKRVKAGLRESCVKARERVEIFNETLSVFNNFFPTIPSKKRSRVESFSNGRPNALLTDQTVLGPSLNKMGMQNHAANGSFELEHQKSGNRTKTSFPNKRTRTSLGNALVRPSSTVDRNSGIPRLADNGAVQADNRTLSISVDGWEKTKMKKRRSGIKPDVSASLSTKSSDRDREAKQGMRQTPLADARSRLSVDSHGVRPAVANGAVRVGKPDGVSQPNGLTVRLSNPKGDLVNNSPPSDRRECSGGSDKEKVNIRAVNKLNFIDNFRSASPTSTINMNPSIRAPRSGSANAPKLSLVSRKATASGDLELSNCSNKPPLFGVKNGKRTAPLQSASPVARWAGQRPQKISRSARRTSLLPVVSNNDEIPVLDTGSDVSDNGTGAGSARRLTSNYPRHIKLKSDPLSSTVLAQSEESEVPEIKYKDKGRKSTDIDEKAIQKVQKVPNPSMPPRKNKLAVGKDFGVGMRKGRIGRNFASTRSLIPMKVEKPANVGTAKQLRSARLGFETESKTGCLPTRKISDRKAYTRQKHATANAASYFFVGSDDVHDELLAAARSAINPAHALSSSFWKQMEPVFGFISGIDVAYLEQQRNSKSIGLLPTPIPSEEHNGITPNRNGHVKCWREMENAIETQSIDHIPENSGHEASDVSLCQRLLAAMISGEDFTRGNEELEFDSCGTEFELDGELGKNGINHPDNLKLSAQNELNGHIVTEKQEHTDVDFHIYGVPNDSNFVDYLNGVLSDQKLKPSMTCSQAQYDSMCISEKLLLEVQSVGIMPDIQLEDEGISEEIGKLEEIWCGQVAKKNSLVDTLLKSVSEIKVQQEKEFVQRAHDKLVAMAYEKYMTCRGPNATGGKSSGNKMAKQASLTFIKQTLEQCHKFDDTGKSCFHEPMLKDIFLSGSVHPSAAPSLDTCVDGESAKLYIINSCSSFEVSASMSLQPSPQTSQFVQNVDSHIGNFCDLPPPVNHSVEQGISKEHTWSNRVKKRELLLDDVGGTVGTSSSFLSGIGGSLSGSTKGKRSGRDREGKGHNIEVLSGSESNRIGRPVLSNVKGERKSKAKPKQKTTQLSVSMKGLVGKAEQPKRTLHLEAKSREINGNNNAKETDGFGLELEDPIDLSHLQLPGIDELNDTQGQDLGSWLNIDDEGLQDHDDFMGLEIPMDDLSDLNMMV